VLEGGADWQNVRSDGSTALDVRLVLQSSDGALIGMTYRGIRQGAPDVIARVEKGEAVDPVDYYFRIASLFETAAPGYAWLNNVVAIGIGQRRADGATYSIFEVLDLPNAGRSHAQFPAVRTPLAFDRFARRAQAQPPGEVQ
jgi:hypothetical protein